MKILVLTSRYTATRDIIDEDFGRQTRLFSALKELDNDIDFLVADYRKFETKDLKLHGIYVSIRPFSFFYFLSFLRELNNKLRNEKYDFIIATSDPLWGAIGYFYSKKYNVRLVYDLHDNYETYDMFRIPFYRVLDSHVVKNAGMITTVSNSLKNKLGSIRKKDVVVIQNGVDTGLFRPMDRKKCRKAFGFKDEKIIAYTGSIQTRQGIDLLIETFRELKTEIKNLKLVIAGRFVYGKGSDTSLRYNDFQKFLHLIRGFFTKGKANEPDLTQEGVKYLGSLPQNKVAMLINAADVCVVPNRENDFTKYCFPYKVVEYMACNTPIVATRLGDVEFILGNYKGSLCNPDDKNDMVKKIKAQISKGKINYRKNLKESTWGRIALKLNNSLKKMK